VKHLTDVADETCRTYKPAAGSLAVDVGSNDGTLLKGFKKNGMKVLGIDPAVEIAQKATESGIETLPAFVSLDLAKKIRKERGPAAVVTCFNAFAHSDDMAGMAASIQHLLADDGVFVFEVSYLLDIMDQMLLGVIFHEHMGHHSLKPMVQFLKKHGMEMIDVQRNDLQGGSFIGFAQRAGGPHPVKASVAKLLQVEKERGLEKPETVKAFSTRLKRLKHEMGELLADWSKRGATVAAYGAARSGPTLIAELGLSKAIRFLVDDHPQKVNKFSPGDHIPVLPTTELYARKPDYVIILAWVHAEKIIAENRKYLEQGGHFVLCCPEVKVIGAEYASVSSPK
jgi:SAM-dependent methyltransferase